MSLTMMSNRGRLRAYQDLAAFSSDEYRLVPSCRRSRFTLSGRMAGAQPQCRLNLSHGYWMPIAAIAAMKASLDQTTIIAAQRLAGAFIGAAAAALLLLLPASEHGLRLLAVTRGLEVVALVILINGWRFASGTTRCTAGPSPREC